VYQKRDVHKGHGRERVGARWPAADAVALQPHVAETGVCALRLAPLLLMLALGCSILSGWLRRNRRARPSAWTSIMGVPCHASSPRFGSESTRVC